MTILSHSHYWPGNRAHFRVFRDLILPEALVFMLKNAKEYLWSQTCQQHLLAKELRLAVRTPIAKLCPFHACAGRVVESSQTSHFLNLEWSLLSGSPWMEPPGRLQYQKTTEDPEVKGSEVSRDRSWISRPSL